MGFVEVACWAARTPNESRERQRQVEPVRPREPIVVTLRPSELYDDVLPLHIAQITKSRPKSLDVDGTVLSRNRAEKPNPRDLGRLLCQRRKRPSWRGAQQNDELAPPH